MAWIHFWFEWRCVQVERVMLLIFHFLVFPLGGRGALCISGSGPEQGNQTCYLMSSC